MSSRILTPASSSAIPSSRRFFSTAHGFLQSLIGDQAIREERFDTGFIGRNAVRIVAAGIAHPRRHARNGEGAVKETAAAAVQRTARENVADLCDDGTYLEYGALAVAAQRRRRSVEELREVSPADGLIAGVGTVNSDLFGKGKPCAVLAYDYTVFAGTQGFMGHKKTGRLLHLCDQWNLPVIIFAEGGGGRPGSTCPPSSCWPA